MSFAMKKLKLKSVFVCYLIAYMDKENKTRALY